MWVTVFALNQPPASELLSLHQDFGSLNQRSAEEAVAIYKSSAVFNQVYKAWMFVILPLKTLPVFPSGILHKLQ